MSLRHLFSYIIPIFAVFLAAASYQHAKQENRLCQHRFALCTSALCIPLPNEPDKAICFCDVEEGPSLSTVPCESIQPSSDANGIQTVYSTFSLKQAQNGKLGLKCPDGTPWTWCLNKKCTVDPSDPKKAICTCDIKRTGDWMTLGGDCNKATCKTGYWSGASLNDVESGSEFLVKALGLQQSPLKWCPISP